jgi:hypothetical protein
MHYDYFAFADARLDPLEKSPRTDNALNARIAPSSPTLSSMTGRIYATPGFCSLAGSEGRLHSLLRGVAESTQLFRNSLQVSPAGLRHHIDPSAHAVALRRERFSLAIQLGDLAGGPFGWHVVVNQPRVCS